MSFFVNNYTDSGVVCVFNRGVWNDYETDQTRIVNHLEGWHAALNRTIPRPNPSIYVILIKELKNLQQNVELDV